MIVRKRKRQVKVVLILVLFNLQSGSEVITADFDDPAACDRAARRTFQGVDPGIEIRPIVPAAGVDMIEGTMVAYGVEGGEIGIYSCNPIAAAKTDS